MSEFFVALDRNYDIAFANRAVAEAVRLTYGNIEGQNHWELWPELRGTVVESAYAEAFATGRPAKFEIEFPGRDVWLDVSAYPTGNHLHVYFRDVTAQKREIADERRHSSQLRAMVDGFPQIAWAAEPDLAPTYLNRRWYEYTGEDSSIPYDSSRTVHPDDLAALYAQGQAALRQGVAMEGEARLRRHDGVYRWHLVRLEPHCGSDGALLGWFGTSTDVHAQKSVEAELRELVDAVGDGYLAIDAEWRISGFNAKSEEYFGLRREDVLAKSLYEVFPATRGSLFEREYQRALAENRLVAFETKSTFADRWVEVRALPYRGGLAVFFNDVTERRRAEEMLRATTDAVPSLIAYLDEGLRYQFINRAYEGFFGKPREEVLGQHVADLIGEAAFKVAEPRFRAALSGEDVTYESWLPFRDIGRRYMRVHYIPRRDFSGRIIGIYALVLDQTERRLAMEALELRERRLQFLIQLSDAIRSLTTPREIARVACRVVGEFLNANRCVYARVDEQRATVEVVDEYLNEAPSIVGTYPLNLAGDPALAQARRGETARIADTSTDPTTRDTYPSTYGPMGMRALVGVPYVREGQFFGAFGVHSTAPREWTDEEVAIVQDAAARVGDAIERAQAELDLRESEERTRLALAASGMGTWEMNVQTDEAKASPDVGPLYGMPPGYAHPSTEAWLAMVHPDDRERLRTARQALFSLGTPYNEEFRVLLPEGGVRWLHSRATLFRTPEGAPWKAVGVVSDVTAQRNAEETLRESESRYRALADALPQLIWSTDANGKAEYANARWKQFFGLDLVEVEAANYANIIHPDDLAGTLALWKQSLERGIPLRKEYRVRRFDGEYRWHLLMARPARDADGNIVRWFGSLTDLEPVKQLEQDLRESGDQLRLALLAADAGVWDLNLSTGEITVDDVVRRHFGLEPSESIHTLEEALARVVPEDRTNLEKIMRGAATVGGEFRVEFRSPHPRLGVRWLVAAGGWVGDHRMVGVMYDVTDTRRRVAALEATISIGQMLSSERETDQIVQALTDASTKGIGAEFGAFFYNVVDERGEILTLYTLSGAPRSAFEGYPMPRATHVFGPTFRGDHTVLSGDITQDPRYGQMPPYHGMPAGHLPVRSYLAVPVVSRTGEVLGGLFFAHSRPNVFDEGHARLVEAFAGQAAVAYENALLYRRLTSTNEELERMVRERTADLQASNEALMGFTYHVSHDLRAPLRAIVATSRIVQSDYGDELPEEACRLLERQATSANKLGALIDDLLRFSRLSREELQTTEIDLSELAQDAAAEALSSHPNTKVKVVVDSGLTASGDPRLLRLALVNLVENGIKYSPEGGTVRVGRREDGAFFVADEGIGIDPRYHERIFEPFQRLHTDEEFSGTGIGLSNVRQVIQRHGGRIWVESEFGKGSTFAFRLGE